SGLELADVHFDRRPGGLRALARPERHDERYGGRDDTDAADHAGSADQEAALALVYRRIACHGFLRLPWFSVARAGLTGTRAPQTFNYNGEVQGSIIRGTPIESGLIVLRKFWLVFAQACTLCLAVLFVVMTLRPDLLPRFTNHANSVVLLQETSTQVA